MEFLKNAPGSKDLFLWLKSAVERGVQAALEDGEPVAELLTKTMAYRLYGRANVDRWLKEELIVPQKRSGSRFLLSRSALEKTSALSNRITYLTVDER